MRHGLRTHVCADLTGALFLLPGRFCAGVVDPVDDGGEPPGNNALLREDGDALLKEDGDELQIEGG